MRASSESSWVFVQYMINLEFKKHYGSTIESDIYKHA